MRRSLVKLARWVYIVVRNTGIMRSTLGRHLFFSLYDQYKKWLEDPFFNLAKLHPEIFEGGHILDVGANLGYTVEVFSNVLGKSFSAYAFEPDPETYHYLQGRIRRKGLSRIQCFQFAVGSSDGKIDLFRSPLHPADHRVYVPTGRDEFTESAGRPIPVKLVSLDTFCREAGILDSIQFVKVDVQGFELEVLKGMKEILSRNPDVRVALEIDLPSLVEAGTSVHEVLEFFGEFGLVFELVELDGNLKSVTHSELESIARDHGYIDILIRRSPHFVVAGRNPGLAAPLEPELGNWAQDPL